MSKPAGDPPLCDCHGEPKMWKKNRSRKEGGYWTCFVGVRESRRRFRLGNPEYIATYRRRHYEANKDDYARRARLWAQANPEKRRSHGRKHASKRIVVAGIYLGTVGFTDSEVKEMISGSSD